MDYAVVIYFDKSTENSICNLQKSICENNVNRYLLDTSIPPHVTLSLFSADINEDLIEVVRSFANSLKVNPIKLTSIGLFNTNPAVLYLAPVLDNYLKDIHENLHNKLSQYIADFNSYYLSEFWVPHCAIGLKLSKEELIRAVDVAYSEFVPITCTIRKIVIAKCNTYKEIRSFDLSCT
jgi:hypothetical protein